MLTNDYVLSLKQHKQYGFCVLHENGQRPVCTFLMVLVILIFRRWSM